MIFLSSPFAEAWKDKDPFEEIKKIQGKTYREVATRQTLNFKFKGESFYIKMHHGTSLKEVLKNLICLRMPVLGARNEFEAIKRLHELGVSTMEIAAFGERGINPLRKESFIITRDLNPAISLEDFCRDWNINPPSYSVKKKLIEKVAIMVRGMHQGGVNHRDCYICHFLLKFPFNLKKEPNLAVIDLHRAQIRNSVPKRWRDKDIIALFFSTRSIGLNYKDYLRFAKVYFGNSKLKNILKKESKLISKLESKSRIIEERTQRKRL